MFKLFDRKKATLKPLQAQFVSEDNVLSEIDKGFDIVVEKIKNLKDQKAAAVNEISVLVGLVADRDKEIIALKSIVANLRKQKVYAGQRFYDPKNHKAPVVYLCARWNEWYMIRRQNQTTPLLITAEHWTENFGHYELMPRPNTNLKNLG